MNRRSYSIVLFMLLIVVAQAAIAHACPGCKQALANAEGEQANMINGYFWSILFMLAMPFTLLGLFSGSMYLAVRKARKAAGQTANSAAQFMDSALSSAS